MPEEMNTNDGHCPHCGSSRVAPDPTTAFGYWCRDCHGDWDEYPTAAYDDEGTW